MSRAILLTGSAMLALFCSFFAPALRAQVERASIVGKISDATGAAMAGVEVTVTNEATNTSIHVSSGDAGAFTAVNLIPGSYSVTASPKGFRPVAFRNFVLQVGQSARLDITMELGNVEQTVEVTGAIPLLQTENASVGQVIERAAVNALPLNGRNFVQLAILAPGVSGLDYAQSGTINTGKRPDELRPGGTALQANGALSQSNAVLLDGIDNTEMVSQTFVVRPAVEGIQEFKVLTNNAGAEYSRSVGAVVVVTTKSGGNQFHGSFFEFLRNEKLDARNFFARTDAPKPPFKLNQYGASLGGPVLLPKYNGRNRTLNQNISQWFNPTAFAAPPAFTWGTLGRNSLNAPRLYNVDFSISRKFRFGEARELQFRSEFFNGLNHPQFGLPNATAGVGGAGTITSTQRANRQIQFALRFSY